MAAHELLRKKCYLDSSVLAKRYTKEKGSDFVIQIYDIALGKGETLYTSRHAVIEVGSSGMRLFREGRMTLEEAYSYYYSFLRESSACIEFMEITTWLEHKAVQVMSRSHLKAADALHVACALALAELYNDVLFVSADRQQCRAALEEGLMAADPVRGVIEN